MCSHCRRFVFPAMLSWAAPRSDVLAPWMRCSAFPSQGRVSQSAFSGSKTLVGLSRHNLNPSVQMVATPSHFHFTTLDWVQDSMKTTSHVKMFV
jgi:hypothetical protein